MTGRPVSESYYVNGVEFDGYSSATDTLLDAQGEGYLKMLLAVVGLSGACGGVAEGVAKEVDGVALEAEPDVRVHRRGHADVGMAQQLLDDDELDALLQEEGGCRVPEIVKPDASQGGSVEQGVEVPSEGGRLDGGAVGPGEDVAARPPVGARRFAFPCLPLAVPFEGVQALGGQGDSPLRALGLGGQGGQAGGVGALEGAADTGGSAGQVEAFPAQAKSSPLRSPVRRASSNSALSRCPSVAVRSARASSAVRGSKRRGRGVPMRTLRATLREISSSRTACSRADLRTEWT